MTVGSAADLAPAYEKALAVVVARYPASAEPSAEAASEPVAQPAG